ncbi:MAG: acyl-CoA dehydrogenase family protein [Alphaproteobacteria bacterium]|nr:acyl-CoA dehydrogenase family protein [Alphaproteobacteria bacterium]
MPVTRLQPTSPAVAGAAPGGPDPAGPGQSAFYVRQVREIMAAQPQAYAEIDEQRELPASIVDALVERGLFRLLLPRSLDGAELRPLDYVPVIEELAKHDASTAWCVNQNSGCSMSAAYLDPAVAREIFGGPRGILAWGPGPGEAHIVEGGYRVTATWSFASGSHHATWLGCHVPVFGPGGQPYCEPDGSPVVRTMLFPKDRTTFTDIWHVMGLRGTGSDQYSVTDLFVPEAYSPSRDEEAARREDALLYRFSSMQLYASGFAGVALGIARSVLDAFIELARDKIPRGAKRTMRDNNVTQAQVALSQARLFSARAYLFDTLERATEGAARTGRLTLDQRMTIRLAATFAIHQSVAIVDTLYHAAGATAIFNANPFERRFRDIHTVVQQLQGRQQHFETVGQHLLGLEADTSWV